ncbi:MAG: Fis family transcriptional regulator [Nitrospirae bacterium CG18_big_fil_WC_8_21_14_2_50_70_55]|nr:sigma-54-dependent Fis family transcriptional regulator [Deltaproteobacteria bacterium]OIP64352.1 MAG: hypothetical protein AUK30_06965 [Nitrospirae bacterium CG2_30_70_394]PIQ03840.1 MAG: Fis family transcriptional regulator [Nitrospirae bacterium CG18_big_fil_WC_8_21_14_2_50_70_55]PIU78715.1 MAG: Fis family transcriptional regulator [Nitrospirae bacterium CG06_land_8_20_14_3_00_70_43]PIW83735.1 MAG: Fis family transcriptional regulator [Nitrospirae bacterium CG_4_8_14_3_um_filter_70_85]PI
MERVLIVDDEPGVRHFLKKILERTYEVDTAADGEGALAAIAAAPPAAILLDWKLPGIAGVELLRAIRGRLPEVSVVVITAFGDTDTAIQVIEEGAFDYLTKPLDLDTVREVIGRGVHVVRAGEGAEIREVAPGERLKGNQLIGNAPPMVAVYKQIAQVAKLDVTVLIRGDSGTGKELVARTLHRYSRRASAPFVAVNCAAIPENLLESELFGYAPGAFTGADPHGRPGRFEQAAGGTLFLDEVGDMELALQAKVLRVLQDHTFQRLGGNATLSPDVRVLAATNRPLEEWVAEGGFRIDLFHRLNGVTIELPALRDHFDDLPDLLAHFIQRLNVELGLHLRGFEPAAVALLAAYPWPGNVRELENTVRRAMVMARLDYLSADAVRDALSTQAHAVGGIDPRCASLVEQAFDRAVVDGVGPYAAVMAMVERLVVKVALARTKGNQVQAARLLGITRTTLRKKIEEYGL